MDKIDKLKNREELLQKYSNFYGLKKENTHIENLKYKIEDLWEKSRENDVKRLKSIKRLFNPDNNKTLSEFRSERMKEYWKNKKDRTVSEDTRLKMSESQKERWKYTDYIVSDETKNKISLLHKDKPLSEEHKQKLGIQTKRRWEDPEFRRKVSEAQRKRWVLIKSS